MSLSCVMFHCHSHSCYNSVTFLSPVFHTSVTTMLRFCDTADTVLLLFLLQLGYSSDTFLLHFYYTSVTCLLHLLGHAGAPQVQVTYPPLAAMVAYIQSRHAALKQAANSPRGSMDMTKQLPLAPKAYLALIAFLRECRSKQEAQPDAPPQEYLGKGILGFGPSPLLRAPNPPLQLQSSCVCVCVCVYWSSHSVEAYG